MYRNRDPDLVIRIALAALALTASAALAETDRCFSADVPAPIVLPDGSVQPEGRLTLCVERELTPVTVLHEVRVDGRPIGLFASHRVNGVAGDSAERAFFVFAIEGRNRLVLEGYAVNDGDRQSAYVLAGDRNRAETLKMARLWGDLPAAGDTQDDPKVLLSRSAN